MDEKFKRKYTWTSVEFDKWVKDQTASLRQKGVEISSATVTHRLLQDFIKPNEIKIEPPRMRGRLKLKKKQIY